MSIGDFAGLVCFAWRKKKKKRKERLSCLKRA